MRGDLCIEAANRGHFELLMWLHLNGCGWHVGVSHALAGNGNLEMLKWTRVRGCPWDERTCSSAAGC